jgi:hypothetical protein
MLVDTGSTAHSSRIQKALTAPPSSSPLTARDGLLGYFAATNIQPKVRHPLFLAVPFTSVLVIHRDALQFSGENDSLRFFICVRGFLLRCERDLAVVNLDTASFCPAPNIVALRSSAFLDCPSHGRHTLIRALGILQGPALGFVPDDRLVQAMYQPALRVRILILLYSRLHGTEFATMPGVAPEVPSGGLDGRTSDSASESDRKRFKTDSESGREQDS